MRRLYKILILLLIVTFTSISIFIIYDKNNANNFRFLSIGDGLAKGLNPDGIKSYNYNDYIEKYLKNQEKKVSYYTYADANISISELLNELIYLDDSILKEYLHTSDLIILSIGEEEIYGKQTLEEIETNLKYLIEQIKRYNSQICLLGHYQLNGDRDARIIAMNKIFKRVAKDNDIIYINTENITSYLSHRDNIYPTIRGYKEISELIISAIKLKNV